MTTQDGLSLLQFNQRWTQRALPTPPADTAAKANLLSLYIVRVGIGKSPVAILRQSGHRAELVRAGYAVTFKQLGGSAAMERSAELLAKLNRVGFTASIVQIN